MSSKVSPVKVPNSDTDNSGQKLLSLIAKYVATVPESEFEKLPKDSADQHDYYLYQAAKGE